MFFIISQNTKKKQIIYIQKKCQAAFSFGSPKAVHKANTISLSNVLSAGFLYPRKQAFYPCVVHLIY